MYLNEDMPRKRSVVQIEPINVGVNFHCPDK